MPRATRAGGAIPGPTLEPLHTAADRAFGNSAAPPGAPTIDAAASANAGRRPFITHKNSAGGPMVTAILFGTTSLRPVSGQGGRLRHDRRSRGEAHNNRGAA